MALKTEISTRNLEITDRIQTYIKKKTSKLNRYLRNIDEVRVDLAHVKSARSPSDRQVAQLTVRGRGFVLRTEERSDDIFSAFDAAMDKMQRKIERYKGKHLHGRAGKQADTSLSDLKGIAEKEDQTVIARRKTFVLTPMSEAEALEQMRLLGHENFFIFYNDETASISVLYRRRDGSYGLIEPKID